MKNRNYLSVTVLMSLLIIVMGSTAAVATNAPATNPNCPPGPSRNIQMAFNNGLNAGNSVINGIVQKPDTSFISKCLGSLSMPNFGINLGLPNIMQMLQNVCQMAVQNIKQVATSTLQNVTGMPLSFSGGNIQVIPPSISNAFSNGFGTGVNIPTTNSTISTNNTTITPMYNSPSPSTPTGAMGYLLPQLNP